MMNRSLTKLLLVAAGTVLVLLLAGIAFAEESEQGDKPAAGAPQENQTIYKKRTVYDFEDDTITGDLTKPDGEYIDARRKVKHQNLIKIRENFKEKVLGSVSKL